MKNVIKQKKVDLHTHLLILTFIVSTIEGTAQNANVSTSACLENGDFTQTVSPCRPSHECPAIADCIYNWYPSHGSPQLINGEMFMWYVANRNGIAGNNDGEGIYASYNFLPHQTYQIILSAHTTGTGIFNVFAAKNLTPEYYADIWCGGRIQSEENIVPPIITQAIFNKSDDDPSHLYIKNSFIPNDTYNQFWIYPSTSSSSQYNLYVDYVTVCPDCSGNIIYNSGVVPSGDTKAGYIYAGSTSGSGGSGTVTINSSQETNLYAYNSIELDPNFNATVTGTGSLTIDIVDCPISQLFVSRKSSGLSNAQSNYSLDKQPLYIYPNPFHSTLNLQLTNIAEGWQSIKIINILGGFVRVIDNKSNIITKTINVDMTNLEQGIYFIQLQTKTKVFTQKVVKN